MVAVVINSVLLLLPLLLISSGFCAQDTHAVLLNVVDAIEKLISFYRTSYQHMNLDGIYGLKVVEGQIQRILEEHGRGQHASLSPSVIQRLSIILQDCRWIGAKAIAAVRADDEGYFENLAFLITQPWTLLKQHRKVIPTSRWDIPVYQSVGNYKLDEEQSDRCMMEITVPNKAASGQSRSRCSLTKDCGQVMTRRGLTDYGITHQLLWTALAEKAGCGDDMNSLMKTLGFNSTEHMQQEFCTNNFYEMLTVVHVFMSGKVQGDYQDMFMEQQFVCPTLGFFEFLKKDYLDQILSWQQPSGCFGTGSEEDSQKQAPQNLPPKMDLGKLSASNKLKNLSKITSLDMKKQQMQQQLKELKSNNQLLQSMLQEDAGNSPGGKAQQNLQALNEERMAVPGILPGDSRGVVSMDQDVPALGQMREEGRGFPSHQGVQPPGAKDSPVQGAHQQNVQQHFNKPVLQQVNRFKVADQAVGNLPQRQQYDNVVRLPDNAPNRIPDNAPNILPDNAPNILPDHAPVRLPGNSPVQMQGNVLNEAHVDLSNRLKDQLPVIPQRHFPNGLQGVVPANPQINSLYSGARLQGNALNNPPAGQADINSRMQDPVQNKLHDRQFPSDTNMQMNLNGKHPNDYAIMKDDAADKLGNVGSVAKQPAVASRSQAAAALQHPDSAGGPVPVVRVRAEGQRHKVPLPPAARGGVMQGRRLLSTSDAGHRTMRKLLVEKDMPGGCLAHKTGVASGALVMYLRYLIDPGPLDVFAPHEFYPDSARGLLGDGDSYRKVMNFLGGRLQQQNILFDSAKNGQQQVFAVFDENEGEDDLDDTGAAHQGDDREEDDVDDGEYKMKDELYPDQGAGANQDQVKKVVHFGVNAPDDGNRENYNHLKDDDYDRKEDEEEGADYIKRVKGEDDKAALSDKKGDEDDTEYTYYDDDNDKSERGIIKRHKPQAPPQNGIRIRAHHRHKPQPAVMVDNSDMGQADSPPSKMLVLLLSSVSFALLIAMCRFLRKRRVPFRHGHRGSFRL